MRPDRRPCGRFLLRYLAALLLVLSAIIVSACGGGGKEKEAATGEAPEAAATAAATTTASLTTTAATSSATPEEEATAVASGPAEAFAKLKSYRMNMRFTLGGTAAEAQGALALDLDGAFVAPDRSQTHVNVRLGDLQLEEESITVGGQTWVKTGDNWVEGKPEFEVGDLSPGALLQELGAEQLLLLKPSKETINGVDSLRYSIDRADVDSLRGLGALFGGDGDMENMPEDFNVDLWLAEDGGWPVRITMTAQGAMDSGDQMSMDFSVDVTDVNDAGIKIEPPSA